MIETFSHSKIQIFLQCKYKYKLQYIDKIKIQIPNTIEMHLGSVIHHVLEKLNYSIKKGPIEIIDNLIKEYELEWNKTYSREIIINDKRLTAEDYKFQGIKIIIDHYKKNYPFTSEKIVDIETKKFLSLDNETNYHIRIDKLSKDNENNFFVCDYKTNFKIKTRDELNSDTQLAMYSLWVRENYKDAKRIFLKWEFLTFGENIILEKNEKELFTIKKDIEKNISSIINCKLFETNVTGLCNWCIYKNLCPEFNKNIKKEITIKIKSENKKGNLENNHKQKKLFDF